MRWGAADRWEARLRQEDPDLAELAIERISWVFDVATDPLEFGCPRIEVDTTDGYSPDVDDLIRMVETEHDSTALTPVAGVSHGRR